MSGGIHDGRVEIAEETAERRTSAEIANTKKNGILLFVTVFCARYMVRNTPDLVRLTAPPPPQ